MGRKRAPGLYKRKEIWHLASNEWMDEYGLTWLAKCAKVEVASRT